MRRLLRACSIAFRFLTRLPVPATGDPDDGAGDALVCFPVVGLVLGAAVATVAWLGSGQLPAPVLAAILVALLAALTGGLHVDGLADVFDGVSGGHGDRERIMAIMRDSRVGAHGALAVLLVLMVKVFALSEIVRLQRLEMVMLFPVVARAAVVALIVLFPYLREAGMGRGFKQRASGRHLLGAWAVGGVGVGFAGWEAAVPAAISVLTALAVGVWMQRRLGGLTGDVYGAAVELAEAAFLAVASR